MAGPDARGAAGPRMRARGPATGDRTGDWQGVSDRRGVLRRMEAAGLVSTGHWPAET